MPLSEGDHCFGNWCQEIREFNGRLYMAEYTQKLMSSTVTMCAGCINCGLHHALEVTEKGSISGFASTRFCHLGCSCGGADDS